MNERKLAAKTALAISLAIAAILVLPGTLAGAPSAPPAPPQQSPQAAPVPVLPDAVGLVGSLVPVGGLPVGTGLPTSGQVFDAPSCNYVEPPQANGAPGRSRPSLRIGVNDYGTFGLGPQVSTPIGLTVGTGFQMPIGPAHENLAIGWWGEGYLVHFTNDGGQASYYPSDGVEGTIQRVDDFYLDSGRYTTYRVTVAFPATATAPAGDGLLADFEFTLDKQTCDVTLRTHFQNQSDFTMSVDYKRVVDWDNLDSQSGGAVFSSDFQVSGNTITATRYVNKVPHYECRTTAKGLTLPYAIDAFAWDDTHTVGPGSTFLTSYSGDGNAGFNFVRNGLAPGATWDTVLVYDCSFLTPSAIIECPPAVCAVSACLPVVGCIGTADKR